MHLEQVKKQRNGKKELVVLEYMRLDIIMVVINC